MLALSLAWKLSPEWAGQSSCPSGWGCRGHEGQRGPGSSPLRQETQGTEAGTLPLGGISPALRCLQNLLWAQTPASVAWTLAASPPPWVSWLPAFGFPSLVPFPAAVRDTGLKHRSDAVTPCCLPSLASEAFPSPAAVPKMTVPIRKMYLFLKEGSLLSVAGKLSE